MGLFGKKEKKDEVKAVKSSRALPVKAGAAALQASLPGSDIGTSIRVIRQPRITEKATALSQNSNVYVFEVSQLATKQAIRLAVQTLYKVTPKKIRTVRNPRKILRTRGKIGHTTGVKKAYVSLPAGESITIA